MTPTTHTTLINFLTALTPDRFTFNVDWTGTSDILVYVRRSGWLVSQEYVATVHVNRYGTRFNSAQADPLKTVAELNRMFDLVENS